MKIVRNTKAVDALQMSRKIVAVFQAHGLYCPSCRGVAEETIEKIALNNGLELNGLLEELNAALE